MTRYETRVEMPDGRRLIVAVESASEGAATKKILRALGNRTIIQAIAVGRLS